MTMWSPASWQYKKSLQQPEYTNQQAVLNTVARLSQLPPLVSTLEIRRLQQYLAEASQGLRFIIQGGDCAESFAAITREAIVGQVHLLADIRHVLQQGLHKPVTCIGRIAGQYAKPRSRADETADAITLPAYQGDLINDIAFTAAARQPDPERMLQGYMYATLTMNYLRQLLAATDAGSTSGRYDEFFVSHEALLLHYEQSLTHKDDNGLWYNLGTHYPWLGMRTGIIEGAHVEYLRGIANPIAVKVGPDADPKWLAELLAILDPEKIPGRITLITRIGWQQVATCLPELLEVTLARQHPVMWSCDPMHGNTYSTDVGIKTRSYAHISNELRTTAEVHHEYGTALGGVHLELTSDAVKECLGGPENIHVAELVGAYKSLLDPRLNRQQALAVARDIVKDYQKLETLMLA